MFWIFIIIAGGAATFSALGMYSVWFKLLATSLNIATIVILGLVGYLLWRYRYPKS